MARRRSSYASGGGIEDLLYLGAFGVAGMFGYRAALEGKLGASAFDAAAELYKLLHDGQVPPYPVRLMSVASGSGASGRSGQFGSTGAGGGQFDASAGPAYVP